MTNFEIVQARSRANELPQSGSTCMRRSRCLKPCFNDRQIAELTGQPVQAQVVLENGKKSRCTAKHALCVAVAICDVILDTVTHLQIVPCFEGNSEAVDSLFHLVFYL